MKKKMITTLLGITVLLASGCSGLQFTRVNAQGQTEQTAVAQESTTSSASQETQTEEAADAATETTSGSTPATITPVSSLDLADQFSKKDLDDSWSTKTDTVITLDGDSIQTAGGGVTVEGTTATIQAEGTYILSGTLEDGQIIVAVDEQEKVHLVLNGVTMSNDDSACIFVQSADKVIITLAEGSENTLSDTGATYLQPDEGSTVDAVIFSRDDLSFNGSGSLTVNAQYKHAIVSKDDLVITDGTYSITAAGKGLVGQDSLRIKDGSFRITAEDDALHTSRNDKAGKGYLYIEGGDFTLESGDDGMHAATALVIAGGKITVTRSYEGLEGATIDILDGEIQVTSSDDGFNAAYSTSSSDSESEWDNGGWGMPFNGWGEDPRQQQGDRAGGFGGGMMDAQEDAYLRIAGGTIRVDASGDGLDSNGYLYMEGGTVYVDGPVNDGNGALDVGVDAVVTGGTLVAAGSSGMAETFGTSSTQVSFCHTFSTALAGGTQVTLTDASGKEILSYTPSKTYSNIVISTPDLAEGSYTIAAGSESETITLSGVSTRTGAAGGMGFGGGFGGHGSFDGTMPDGGSMGEGQQPGGGNGMGPGGQGGMGPGGQGGMPPMRGETQSENQSA